MIQLINPHKIQNEIKLPELDGIKVRNNWSQSFLIIRLYRLVSRSFLRGVFVQAETKTPLLFLTSSLLGAFLIDAITLLLLALSSFLLASLFLDFRPTGSRMKERARFEYQGSRHCQHFCRISGSYGQSWRAFRLWINQAKALLCVRGFATRPLIRSCHFWRKD